MGQIISGNHGVPIEINGMPDHGHILTRIEPVISVSDFLRQLKSTSSGWVRRNYDPQFRWQRRYGAFSVSESASDAVRQYIRNQKQHHKRQTFEDEYKECFVFTKCFSIRSIFGIDVGLACGSLACFTRSLIYRCFLLHARRLACS